MKIPFPKYEAEIVAEIEAYLDQDYQTEITEESEHQADGLKYTFARGFSASGVAGTRNVSNYARPMIQPIDDGAFSGSAVPGTTCGPCGDFSRSWACAEHPQIDWDTERRQWKRPCTGDRSRCGCDPCHERRERAAERSSGYVSMGTDGLRPPERIYDQLVERFGAERMIQRYIATDGLIPQREAERRRALVDTLPSFSITFEAHTDPRHLEISGETVQAPASTIRIEVESDDDD